MIVDGNTCEPGLITVIITYSRWGLQTTSCIIDKGKRIKRVSIQMPRVIDTMAYESIAEVK